MKKLFSLSLLTAALAIGMTTAWPAENPPANPAPVAAEAAPGSNAAAAKATGTNVLRAALSASQKLKEVTTGPAMIQEKIFTYLIENGPKLFGAFLIMLVAFLLARSLGNLLMRWMTKREMEPPVRMLIARITKLLILGFALIIALGTMGFNVMALVTGIGVAGVGVSLATQGVLSNLVAGLMIIFTKPFRVGEYIEMVGVEGQVSSIELFSTTLLHWDRSKVVIPNRRIVGEVLHNYGTVRQLDLSVGVAYDTNLPQALDVIRDVLRGNSRVMKEFAPVVGVSAMADSSINIAVKPWVGVNDFIPAGAELNMALVEQFRTHGIQMPFPQREIRLLNGEPQPPAMPAR